jgi:hypothetical protein
MSQRELIEEMVANGEMTQDHADALLSAAKSKSRRKSEEDLRAKYPHIVEGSVAWDEGAKKQACLIACTVCGEHRRIFTSDAFQVSTCKGCAAEAKKAKRAEKRKLVKEGLELLAQRQGEEASE